jgi:N-glycosylase/DNA lyase
MENYFTDGGDIYINKNIFDAEKTALSGQVFRYLKRKDGYTFLSKEYKADCFFPDGEGDFVKLTTNNSEYFVNYFDLNENYDIIRDRYSDISVISAAAACSKGMRMLKQDAFETLISFIISANNNIPRIRLIIERLCGAVGRDAGGYRAFPTASEMRGLDESFYSSIGAGYRAEYLQSTVRAVNDGFDLNKPFFLETEEAQKYLMRLKGVGPKVADCILLFAYGKGGVFPVDTWIKKSAKECFGIESDDVKIIRKSLIGMFGEDSGIIQQYIYFYIRGLKYS